jgi:acetyl esterase/lipase
MMASVLKRLVPILCLFWITVNPPVQAQYGPLIVDLDRSPDHIIDLWNASPPGGTPTHLNEHFVERDNVFHLPDRAIRDVTRPRLSVFKPERPDGSAILLIPGGGYKHVVVEKEGFEGARWFSRQGATVYVLFYRLPHQGWAAGPDTPLQDAQRAIRLIRSRAEVDNINPDKVLVMGFSAGGHLAGSLLTRFDAPVYPPTDLIDEVSARPDAGVLVYPVITLTAPYTHRSTSENMVGAAASQAEQLSYSVEHEPPANMPPTFLLHASDDTAVPVENSLMAFAAFKAAGAPVSLHVFTTGGHGFGMRGIDAAPVGVWPDLVMAWGRDQQIFSAKSVQDVEP